METACRLDLKPEQFEQYYKVQEAFRRRPPRGKSGISKIDGPYLDRVMVRAQRFEGKSFSLSDISAGSSACAALVLEKALEKLVEQGRLLGLSKRGKRRYKVAK